MSHMSHKRAAAERVSVPTDGAFVFVALLTLIAASFYVAILRALLNRDFPLATLEAMIDGTARTPFQYRILIPWLVGYLRDITGLSVMALYQLAEALAVAGVILSTRYLLLGFFPRRSATILSFGALLILPWNYLLPREIALFIPADLPAVAFFTLGLALIARGKWTAFYPLFIIATFNRETTCFLSGAFALTQFSTMRRTALVAHLGAQTALWVAIKVWLAKIYAGNPGEIFEIHGVGSNLSHLAANLEFLFTPERALILLSSFGFLWIPLVLWRGRIGEPFIRLALWTLPIYALAMLVIGNLNEIRIFGEFIPLVWTANLLLFRALFDNSRAVA